MNINHYPSKELCKKLTAIWFPPTEYSSTMYHMYTLSTQWNVTIEVDDNKDPVFYFMPNVMEMLDVIPQYTDHGELCIFKDWVAYVLFQQESTDMWGESYKKWKHLPDKLAEMILWLHEKKLISFK